MGVEPHTIDKIKNQKRQNKLLLCIAASEPAALWEKWNWNLTVNSWDINSFK